MSFFNFTKIKVNYDYDGHKISTEVLPYKTIKHLKDIARTIFFSITSDFKLFYGQKDLSLYENNLIAEFFKNKSIISLKIVPIKKINKNKSQKLKQLVYTPNSNSKSNILMNSYNNNNYSNTINNNNSGKKVNNYKIKNLFKREQLKCEQCKNDIISNYCRICKKFICNECRFNSHELHKISQIDSENLVESSKLYAFTLQREILTNFKITKFYNNKIKVKNQISTRKDKITDLLNQIDIKYEKMLKEINLDLNNNEENNNNEEFINNMLNKYEIQTKDANEEIDNIINDIYLNFTKQRKKMTFETFRDYISILNEKDEEISLISKDLYKYKINFEIIEKINNMFDKIEKIILDVLNSKQIFGVDDETNKMYKMIKKQNENNNNNNNINEEDDEEEKNAVKGKMKFKKKYVIDANKKKKDEEKNEDDLLYNEDEEVEMINLNKNVDDNNNNNSENAIEQREEDKKEVNYSENNNEINDENNRDKNSEKYYYNENNNEYNNNENENNKNTDNINDNSNINVNNNNEIEMDNNNNNDINIQTNEKNSLELNENNNNDNKDQIFFEKEEMEDNNIVKNLN